MTKPELDTLHVLLGMYQLKLIAGGEPEAAREVRRIKTWVYDDIYRMEAHEATKDPAIAKEASD